MVLQRPAREICENGDIVSFVCHGAVRPLNVKLSDGTAFITVIRGKKVTGFSNQEKKLDELDKHVPDLTEDDLKARGARYEKAAEP